MKFCSCENWKNYHSITNVIKMVHCPWCGCELEEVHERILIDEGKINIFSGEYSKKMWGEINSAQCIDDLKDALYFVCCRLQEFEVWVRKNTSSRFGLQGENIEIPYEYAKWIAIHLWEKHYKDAIPKWRPSEDIMGVLTQIDNMLAGINLENDKSQQRHIKEG
jgi:hypothetical protein